jgi:hypothetical protein
MERRTRIIAAVSLSGIVLGGAGTAMAVGAASPSQTPSATTPAVATPDISTRQITTPSEAVRATAPALGLPASAWLNTGRYATVWTPARTPSVSVQRTVPSVGVQAINLSSKKVRSVIVNPIGVPAKASASNAGADLRSRAGGLNADTDPGVSGDAGGASFGAEVSG